MNLDNHKVLLLGIDKKEEWSLTDSLAELAELAKTAGLSVAGEVTQVRTAPHYKYYLGSGKIRELPPLLKDQDIQIVITDDELTPSQQKALEEILAVKIIDRTQLILDIFAVRAKTHEAQLQVELAQLEYMLPRLTRMWTHLSKLGGGIGTRGPGEKQLEVDKRQIRKRIILIKKELKSVKKHRHTTRAKRQNIPLLTGALVGYTNAGKSTLMNLLTKASVLVENKLFATLDPTTRKVILPDNSEILITDTVGFIKKLPHQLVTSFHSTLEEVQEADFLIHVLDVSHPKFEILLQTSGELLQELNTSDKPCLLILNKLDQAQANLPALKLFLEHQKNYLVISALDPEYLPLILNKINQLLAHYYDVRTYHIPYQRMDIVDLLHTKAQVLHEEYQDQEIVLKVKVNSILGDKLMGALYK
ncbi:GTPase HflX [bacterium]|nr:GTPase HflX [bacterium]MBT5988651.1 GTPase HflX [bacterium]